MSRPQGSKNKQRVSIIGTDETERLEYLATLLLEIIEEELQESDAVCNKT
jgi:hypothetical protein